MYTVSFELTATTAADVQHRFGCDVCAVQRTTRVPRRTRFGAEPPWNGWRTIWTADAERIDLCPRHRRQETARPGRTPAPALRQGPGRAPRPRKPRKLAALVLAIAVLLGSSVGLSGATEPDAPQAAAPAR